MGSKHSSKMEQWVGPVYHFKTRITGIVKLSPIFLGSQNYKNQNISLAIRIIWAVMPYYNKTKRVQYAFT